MSAPRYQPDPESRFLPDHSEICQECELARWYHKATGVEFCPSHAGRGLWEAGRMFHHSYRYLSAAELLAQQGTAAKVKKEHEMSKALVDVLTGVDEDG